LEKDKGCWILKKKKELVVVGESSSNYKSNDKRGYKEEVDAVVAEFIFLTQVSFHLM